jgi:hypothetical protein
VAHFNASCHPLKEIVRSPLLDAGLGAPSENGFLARELAK